MNIPNDAIAFVGAGAGTGLAVQSTIGGAGIAAMGSAVAIPLVAVGASLGLLCYGAYRFGKKRT